MRVRTTRTVQVDKTVTTTPQTLPPRTFVRDRIPSVSRYVYWLCSRSRACKTNDPARSTPASSIGLMSRFQPRFVQKRETPHSPVSTPINRGATLRYRRILYNGTAGLLICSAVYPRTEPGTARKIFLLNKDPSRWPKNWKGLSLPWRYRRMFPFPVVDEGRVRKTFYAGRIREIEVM